MENVALLSIACSWFAKVPVTLEVEVTTAAGDSEP